MQSSMIRIALAVDDRRVDLALPALRPLGEYLDRVVTMVQPAPGDGAGHRLVRVGGEVLADGESLAASGVVDGELLLLAPALAAPHATGDDIDDLRSAVAARIAPAGGSPPAATLAAAMVVALGVVLIAAILATGGAAGAILAAVVAALVGAGAGLLHRAAPDGPAATAWALASIAAGAASGVAAAATVDAVPWWILATATAGVAAAVATAAVPSRCGLFAPLAVGALAVAGSAAAIHHVDDDAVIAAPIVLGGLLLLDAAPRLGFRMLRPARSRTRPLTGTALDATLRRGRVATRAVEVAGTSSLVVAAAALAVGDDGWGWWLAGLGSVVVALHLARADDELSVVALSAGALAVAFALGTGVAAAEAGWLAAAGCVAAATVTLAALVGAAPRLRPLARRRLARLEQALVVTTAAVAVVAAGLVDALHDLGSSLA